MRAAWIAAIAMAGASTALGQGSAAPAPLAPADIQLVYEELVHTHDGEAYTLNIVGFASEPLAAAAWKSMTEPPMAGLPLHKVRNNIVPRQRYLFNIEPALRERIVNLRVGERTGPVRTRIGWAIAELVDTRAVAAPSLQDVRSAIPGLVDTGTLPTAEQLRNDAAIARRREINGIQSVEDLAKARPDLDLNGLRSSHLTPLMHALHLGRPELVNALLARGADPNRCAHGNCPLRLAIQIGAKASIDALLKAGAKVDGVAPDLGLVTTPLATAAGQGDRALVQRLIDAGARVDGYPDGPTPLMAAAGRAHRAAAELLINNGADPFARRLHASYSSVSTRNAVDLADASSNPAFADWMRDAVRLHARRTGAYAWSGLIEQDGVQHPMDGRTVEIRRAPFRMVVRMHPDREMYVSASTSRDARDLLLRPAEPATGFRSQAAVFAEDGRNQALVIHLPPPAPKFWGGSQAWWTKGNETRFSATRESPSGREYIRNVEEFIVIEGHDKIVGRPIGEFQPSTIHLIVGTRIPLGWLDHDVFEPRFIEIRLR